MFSLPISARYSVAAVFKPRWKSSVYTEYAQRGQADVRVAVVS